MTAKNLIITTGAIFALVAPAANAATTPKKAPAKTATTTHKLVLKAQAPAPAPVFSRGPVIGPNCADVDPTYTRCVGDEWVESVPVPVIAAAPVIDSSVLLSPLDNNTQDG
jgi:hypothetical protein